MELMNIIMIIFIVIIIKVIICLQRGSTRNGNSCRDPQRQPLTVSLYTYAGWSPYRNGVAEGQTDRQTDMEFWGLAKEKETK